MRKLLILMIVEILLVQGFSAASTLSNFGTGRKEAIASLRLPECNDVINITLPAECHVLSAMMNVSAVTPDEAFPDGPVNATVMLNDTALYSFNGIGYGGFGKQSVFQNGNESVTINFGMGGGKGNTTVRLPNSANIQSASLKVTCDGPDKILEVWNRSGTNGERFWMVAGAGDVNNDGYEDFAVGAFTNQTIGLDAGAAYLFYGGPLLDTVPDAVFFGNASGDCFGCPVCGVGDLNGDGYDDLAIGSVDSTGWGTVHVYFGGNPIDNISDLVLTGNPQDQWFGGSIAGKADINGDSYDDLIMFSHFETAQTYGEVIVYYGGKTMNTTPDIVITAPELDSFFGGLPIETPDLNGDGYDDVVISATNAIVDGLHRGKVYIYYGGKDFDNVSDLTLTGYFENETFGYSFSSAGDLNGDEYDDLIVGNVQYYYDRNGTGRSYIYFGGTNMDANPDLILYGTALGTEFGETLGSAGDINGDDFDDVIVGVYGDKTNGENSGAAYIYLGGKNMDNITDYKIYGNPGEYFGFPVTNAGDINNDSRDEVMVGMVLNGTTCDGAVRIYSLESGLLNSSITIGSEQMWINDWYFNGTNETADFAKILNKYINNATASQKDSYGNSFIDIPIDISAQGEGNMTVGNLSIIYSFTMPTIDFSSALNEYIIEQKYQKDSNGNITIPIKVQSSTPGRLKLSDLQLSLDNAPELTDKIPDVIVNEDTVVSDLVDLQQYFKDDYDQAGQLNYQVVSFTNDTIVNVSISGNHYLSVDALTGPQNDNWTGTVDVIVKCSDRWNSTTISNQFRVTIQNVPDPPAFISEPPTNATAGIEYKYQVMAVDGDNDPLNYVLVEKPIDMTMNPQTGLVNWIPRVGGDYLISIMVSDGRFNVFQNFSINVPNQQPKINSSANVTAIKGVPYEYLVNATDADGDKLAFSLISDVSGMTIDAQKGNLSWTPDSTGDFTIKIMVADGKGGTAVQEFLVHVYEKIEPKMDFVTLPEQAVVGGNVAVSGRIIKGSLDIVTVQYRLDSGEWVNVTANETWEINLDTTQIPNGEHKLEVRVFDGITYTDVGTRTFTVKNPVKESAGQFPAVVIGVITIIAVIAVVLLIRTKKRPSDEEE